MASSLYIIVLLCLTSGLGAEAIVSNISYNNIVFIFNILVIASNINLSYYDSSTKQF